MFIRLQELFQLLSKEFDSFYLSGPQHGRNALTLSVVQGNDNYIHFDVVETDFDDIPKFVDQVKKSYDVMTGYD